MTDQQNHITTGNKEEAGWGHRFEVAIDNLSKGVFIKAPTAIVEGVVTLSDWNRKIIHSIASQFSDDELEPVTTYADEAAQQTEEKITNFYNWVNDLTGYQSPQLVDATDHAIAGTFGFIGSTVVPGAAAGKVGWVSRAFNKTSSAIKGFFLTPGLNLAQSIALKSATTGLYASATGGALWVADYVTDNALSKAAPGIAFSIADSVQEGFPDFAELLREHGLVALEKISDFADTGSDALANMVAGSMDELGHNDMADIFRIGNAVTSINFATSLINAGKGQRAQAAIDQIVNKAGVRQDRLEDFFIQNPAKASLLETVANIQLQDVFPDLAEKQAQYKMQPSANTKPNHKEPLSLTTALFNTAGNAPQNDVLDHHGFSIMDTLKTLPGLGFIITLFQKVAELWNNYVEPLFTGKKDIQGNTDRAARVMARNGHIPSPDDTADIQPHHGGSTIPSGFSPAPGVRPPQLGLEMN